MLKKNPLTVQVMNTTKHPGNFISILEKQQACLHLCIAEPTIFLEFTTSKFCEWMWCEFIRCGFPALLSSSQNNKTLSVLSDV